MSSNMRTQVRKWRRLVESLGGKIDRVVINKHLKLYISTPITKFVFVASTSTANQLSELRQQTDLKRLMKGTADGPT